MNAKIQITRRYDIDWLRVIAVLLLIPFHTMHIFILQPYSIVYIKNVNAIRSFEVITGFMHEFHMPLLFLLAGASAYLSLQFRSSSQFIGERFKRLLLPLCFGILFLVPPMTYIYQISIGNKISLLEHYKNFFTSNPGDLSGITGAFTPAHLWFILFLFLFSFAGIPFFGVLSKHNNTWNKLHGLLTKRFLLILMAVPLALLTAVNILGDKNPLVYFLIFLYGYLFMTDEEYQKAINRDKAGFLIAAVIIEIILQCYTNDLIEWSAGWLTYELIRVVNRLLWVFVILGFGNQYLNKPSKVLSYLSGASFPVYILHFPINTVVGYSIVRLEVGSYLKFVLIMILTTVLTLGLYEIIRHSKLICLLLGMKNSHSAL